MESAPGKRWVGGGAPKAKRRGHWLELLVAEQTARLGCGWRLRGAAVAPPSPSMKAAAAVSPPTLRPASGGGMFGAHGKIAYLSLPFCALMRALSARAAAAR